MSILAWIEDQRTAQLLDAPKYNHNAETPTSRSQGLWTRCDNCGVILYIKHLKENIRVCFGCGYHLQMESTERISSLIDSGTWRALDETLSPVDPLQFKDQKPYVERLRDAQKKTGLQDAIQTGTGLLDGIPIALGVMDFNFMGGSMGSVVGEKLTRLIEYATQEGYTLVLVCASGGARMQEGIYSLMQMAKISSALQVYQSCANLLYISVLTSPTTGGVTASFAMLGDLIFAEPKALIGFAGRRVIEQTLAEELPDDFQTAEYLLHHGLLDLIVPRCFLKAALSEIIYLYKNAPKKRFGFIPYGVPNPLSFLEVESVLRHLGEPNSLQNQEEKQVKDSLGLAKQGGAKPVEGTPSFGVTGTSSSENLLHLQLLTSKSKKGETKPKEKKAYYSNLQVDFKALFDQLSAQNSETVSGTNPNHQQIHRIARKTRPADPVSAIELAGTQKIRWINETLALRSKSSDNSLIENGKYSINSY